MKFLALEIPGSEGKSIIPPSLKGTPLYKGDVDNPLIQIAQLGYNLFFYITLFIAVVVILTSGIQIITSKGDSEKIKTARARIIYAIVGLVVLLGAFFILSTLSTIIGVKLPIQQPTP